MFSYWIRLLMRIAECKTNYYWQSSWAKWKWMLKANTSQHLYVNIAIQTATIFTTFKNCKRWIRTRRNPKYAIYLHKHMYHTFASTFPATNIFAKFPTKIQKEKARTETKNNNKKNNISRHCTSSSTKYALSSSSSDWAELMIVLKDSQLHGV